MLYFGYTLSIKRKHRAQAMLFHCTQPNHSTETDDLLRDVAHIDKDAHRELIRRSQVQHFNSADPQNSWDAAWTYCRRQQRAVTAVINGEKWTLSPDGEAWKHGV